MSIKSSLASVVKKVVPGLYWARKIKQYQQHFSEVEMRLLPYLCKREKTSIDIGAAGGVFIANLLTLSKNVIGFEPIPEDAKVIQEMVESTNSNAVIERVALSDKAGEAILKMIVNDSGRSTIEESNDLSDDATEKRGIKVPIKRLDDYNYSNVGFIKIDVEGHELSVLSGARETIRRNMPCLLIEIEDRHKPAATRLVPEFLKEFGYHAYFIHEGKIKPMEEFSINFHQDSKNIGTYLDGYQRKGVYVNNFIFVPKAEVNRFIKDTASLNLL